MSSRIVRTHYNLVEDLGCAGKVVKTCFDYTSISARAEHLGLVNPYLLVAKMAMEYDNDVGKVRHGAVWLLEGKEGETRTI